jgi:hypothetical protein
MNASKLRTSLLIFLLLSSLLLTLTGCSTESAGTLVSKTHSITENFTRISVDCSECHISILPSSDGSVSVVCKEREKYPHMVYVAKGSLVVEEPSRTELMNILALGGEHTEVTVYVPAELTENYSLTLESASGNITVDKAFSFREGELETASGDVTCSASFTEELSVETASGKVLIDGKSYGEIEVDNASGDMCLSKLHCKELTAESASGDLTLEEVLADREIHGETASGKISLYRCDAGSFELETASGNIEGSVCNPMRFITETGSGRVNVPNTDGNPCRLTTASGNIHVEIDP